MSVLSETLERFVQACNDNERLRTMNRDWDRVVVVKPDDAVEEHWIQYRAGTAALVDPVGEADLTVEAAANVLADIFSGAMAPTEPYMNGDLRVYGSQDDVMRLDIISLLIWGE